MIPFKHEEGGTIRGEEANEGGQRGDRLWLVRSAGGEVGFGKEDSAVLRRVRTIREEEGEDSERWAGQGKITRSSELSEIGDEVIPKSGKQRMARSLQTMGEIWRHLRAETELKNYQPCSCSTAGKEGVKSSHVGFPG